MGSVENKSTKTNVCATYTFYSNTSAQEAHGDRVVSQMGALSGTNK